MSYPYDLTPLSQEEQAAAAQDFRYIDRDGNGVLDAKELTDYLVRKMPQLRCFPRLIIHIFGQNSRIDWSQFYYSYRSFSAQPDDDQNYIGKKIFDFIDNDKNGMIDGEEFNRIMDYIDIPKGQLTAFHASDKLNYTQFKKKFYELLKMIWRSTGFEAD